MRSFSERISLCSSFNIRCHRHCGCITLSGLASWEKNLVPKHLSEILPSFGWVSSSFPYACKICKTITVWFFKSEIDCLNERNLYIYICKALSSLIFSVDFDDNLRICAQSDESKMFCLHYGCKESENLWGSLYFQKKSCDTFSCIIFRRVFSIESLSINDRRNIKDSVPTGRASLAIVRPLRFVAARAPQLFAQLCGHRTLGISLSYGTSRRNCSANRYSTYNEKTP